MKAHLNLSIEKDLLNQIKVFAKANNTSVSKLIEEYFKRLVQPTKKSNIIEMIESLRKPEIDLTHDLKKAYHEIKHS